MNKKRLIAYILAMSTLAGCNSVKKNEDNLKETIQTTIEETNEDIYNSHSKSMSYGAGFDIEEDSITENIDTTPKKISGQFYLVMNDSLVYDHNGIVISNLEKYEKVIVINNNINENNYAYIQLSNGYKGYVDYSNLVLLSDQIIDLKQDYYYNSFNDNNLKNNNINANSNQPVVYKFVKENTSLYDWDGNIICPIEKYDIVTMIDSSFNKAYIELTDGTRGCINNDLLYRLPESFVEVDISEQTLYAFNDNKLVLKADVVTGNPSIGTTPGTNLGYTEINGTLYNTKLMGGAPADIFVNMKLEDVKVLDEYAKYGTKVLVHK